MKAKPEQLVRALEDLSADVRLFLLHGPDESGARTLSERITKSLGTAAERIDLEAARLKDDPALLADEAASLSLFGERRYIRIDPAGDDISPAVEALLEGTRIENPVILIAPTVKSSSRLVKLVEASKAGMAAAFYPPEGKAADKIAIDIAREHGLLLAPDVAQRLVITASNDRAILMREIEKLALYLDADETNGLREVTHDVLNALSASHEEGNLSLLVDAVADGKLDTLEHELTQLEQSGNDGIPVLAAVRRRMLILAELRALYEQGRKIDDIMEGPGRAIFWKEKNVVRRQIMLWPSAKLQTAISRLFAAEQDWKSTGSLQSTALDMELIQISRVAASLRR